MITTQNIVSATTNQDICHHEKYGCNSDPMIAGRPGRNVKGIRLYQPAPKPESPDNNMNITAASIIQNDSLGPFHARQGLSTPFACCIITKPHSINRNTPKNITCP